MSDPVYEGIPFESAVVFDLAEARRLAEAGMSQADWNRAKQAWKFTALAWLNQQPIGAEVYSDLMIRAIGLPPGTGPYGRNVIGARFGAWLKTGRIEKTGRMYKPERPESHARGGDHPIYRKLR